MRDRLKGGDGEKMAHTTKVVRQDQCTSENEDGEHVVVWIGRV